LLALAGGKESAALLDLDASSGGNLPNGDPQVGAAAEREHGTRGPGQSDPLRHCYLATLLLQFVVASAADDDVFRHGNRDDPLLSFREWRPVMSWNSARGLRDPRRAPRNLR